MTVASTTRAAPVEDAAKARQPNIIMFLVDDMGWRDASYAGSAFYETPAIDKLARDGMAFTQAYAAYPRCVPSRYALMSGKNPARARMPGGAAALRADEVTFAERLSAGGYATFFAGKWHLGGDPGEMPEDQGFDVNVGGSAAGTTNSHFFPYDGSTWSRLRDALRKPKGADAEGGALGPGLEQGKEGEYLADRLTSETVRLITDHKRRAAGGPFLAVLSHYAVHIPLEAPKKDVARFREKLRTVGGARTPELRDVDGQTKLHQDNPVYAGMLSSVDRSLDTLRKALADLNLDQDTVIIFLSDNGGYSNRGGTSNRRLATSNLPLRAGKGHLYEGGIRVPLIVLWPGHTKPGTASNAVINGTDHFATMLDMAGLSPQPTAVDSLTYAPLLQGRTLLQERGPIYWYSPRPRPNSTGDTAGGAIRIGDWKFIRRYHPSQSDELFNLASDPYESTNLLAVEPRRASEMRIALDTWLRSVDAVEPWLDWRATPSTDGRSSRTAPFARWLAIGAGILVLLFGLFLARRSRKL